MLPLKCCKLKNTVTRRAASCQNVCVSLVQQNWKYMFLFFKWKLKSRRGLWEWDFEILVCLHFDEVWGLPCSHGCLFLPVPLFSFFPAETQAAVSLRRQLQPLAAGQYGCTLCESDTKEALAVFMQLWIMHISHGRCCQGPCYCVLSAAI